jgi:DNA replication licensing factor MCM5
MSGFDEGGIFFSDQSANNGVGLAGSQPPGADHLPTAAAIKYREFLRNFRLEDDFVYRNLLRSAIGLKQYLIEVDIDHLMMFDAKLGNELLQRPGLHLPLFEKVCTPAATGALGQALAARPLL